MPKDASPNGGASPSWPGGRRRVSEMQAKLHRWAVADPGRRFDDLFNLVHGDADCGVAAGRGQPGAKTAGSDGWTVTRIENEIGVPGFLDYRALLKAGSSGPNRCGNARSPNRAGRARFVASEFRR